MSSSHPDDDPQYPARIVVCGKGAEDNPVVRLWGERPSFAFTPRSHWEIGESLNILDFTRGQRSPARASRSTGGSARGSNGRSSTSCSTSIRESTATPRSSPRSW